MDQSDNMHVDDATTSSEDSRSSHSAASSSSKAAKKPRSSRPKRTNKSKSASMPKAKKSARLQKGQKRDAASVEGYSGRQTRAQAKKLRIETSTNTTEGLTDISSPKRKSSVAITPSTTTSSLAKKHHNQFDDNNSENGDGMVNLKSLQSVIDLPPKVPDVFSSLSSFSPCQCLDRQCSRECLSVEYLRSYGWEQKALLKEKEEMEYSVTTTDADPLRLLASANIVPSLENRTRQQSEWFGPRSINWELEDYMDRQEDLAPQMRSILVDWISELTVEYNLPPKTFHLAITLIDKSLACAPSRSSGKADEEDPGFYVPRELLQCLGCACTMIAAKMEMVNPPSVDDFAYISDGSASRRQILNMELDVCAALKFRLQHVTPVHYAHEFLLASEAGPCNPSMPTGPAFHPVLRHMVNYLLELGRVSYELVAVKPSLLAAAAVFLARATLGIREEPSKAVDSRGYWTKTLQFYSGYTVEELKDTVRILLGSQRGAEEADLKAVYNKYSRSSRMRVSTKTVLNHEDLDNDCFVTKNE